MNFKIFIISSLLLINNQYVWSACIDNESAKCSIKQTQEIDLYASRLAMVGKRGRLFPKNHQELDKFCSETKSMINNMEDYMKQCCDRELLNVAKIYIYSLRKNSRTLCGKRNSKRTSTMLKKLFIVAPCLNDHIKNFQCLSAFKNSTRKLLQYKNDHEKIRRACCNYVDWTDCEEKFVHDLKCINNEQNQEFSVDLLRSARGDTQRFLCGDYDETSDQCKKFKNLDPKLFHSKSKMDNRLQSLAFIGLHLIESIGDSEKKF